MASGDYSFDNHNGSTLNVKGDRKIVCATYICESHFSIPDGLDLNDKTKVESWGVKWDRLWIQYVDGTEEDINATYEAQECEDWKRPNKALIVDPIGDVDEYYPDDEEESDDEDEGYNQYEVEGFLTKEDYENDKDPEECDAFPLGDEGLKEAHEFFDSLVKNEDEEEDEDYAVIVIKKMKEGEVEEIVKKYEKEEGEFNPECEICGDYMSDVEEEDYVNGCNTICDKCCDDGYGIKVSDLLNPKGCVSCGEDKPTKKDFHGDEMCENCFDDEEPQKYHEALCEDIANTLVSGIMADAVNRTKPCKKNQCIGMTKKGFRCKHTFLLGSALCRTHTPELIG